MFPSLTRNIPALLVTEALLEPFRIAMGSPRPNLTHPDRRSRTALSVTTSACALARQARTSRRSHRPPAQRLVHPSSDRLCRHTARLRAAPDDIGDKACGG